MKEKIWFSPPHMAGTELSYAQDAIDTNWVARLRPNVNEF